MCVGDLHEYFSALIGEVAVGEKQSPFALNALFAWRCERIEEKDPKGKRWWW